MEVSVVIPNFNGEIFLRDCLESLFKQSFTEFEVIVVDNGSCDKSLSILKEFPAVIIENKENLGFAAAVNQGIKKAKGRYIVLLNNDVICDVNWLKNLVESANKSQKEEMLFASKTLKAKEKDIIDNTGDNLGYTGMPYSLNSGEKNNGQFKEKSYIFSAPGVASLYKRELFPKIGYFDESFFAYYEDTDFSFRAQLAGYKAVFVPEAKVYHLGGATASKINNFQRYYGIRNFLFLIIKDMPAGLVFRFLPRLLFIELVHILGAIFKLKLFTLIKAYGSVIINLPSLFKKRRVIQRNKKATNKYLIFLTDLKEPFIRTLISKIGSKKWLA